MAVLAGEALSAWLHLPNLSMIFLIAVLFCAERFGLVAAVAASFLSFLAYNFFFIEPIYTFTVAEPQELLSLLAFLVVAVLTGSLAGRVRDQAEGVRERAQNIAIALRLFAQALRPRQNSTTCCGRPPRICTRRRAATSPSCCRRARRSDLARPGRRWTNFPPAK